jgi:O-antigen ligase
MTQASTENHVYIGVGGGILGTLLFVALIISIMRRA